MNALEEKFEQLDLFAEGPREKPRVITLYGVKYRIDGYDDAKGIREWEENPEAVTYLLYRHMVDTANLNYMDFNEKRKHMRALKGVAKKFKKSKSL